ncbi:alpha/beta fold hydrolase [Blattabacterium cuenoti]|uniref:alpha/beta fold hydrolase n=1 Tax=Blattabacterium cuenoti TaxID=1653831 RepID=UPI00163B6421|nr:alpha/beta hydrolase [Blattabacterium cuenoti]
MFINNIYIKKNFSLNHNKNVPVLIFLHGFMGSSFLWNGICQSLQKEYKIISIDLPGHGKSIYKIKKEVISMEWMADVLKNIIEALFIKKAIFIGHSMGGYISLAFAEKYPEILLGLCLLHSTAKKDSFKKMKQRVQSIRMVKSNYYSFINQIVPKWFNQKTIFFLKKEISLTKKIAYSTNQHSVISFLKGMIIRNDREFLLKKKLFPKLYIFGIYDSILEEKEIDEETKNGYRTYVEKIYTGHMGHVEKPEVIKNILSSFINQCISG